MMENTGVYTTKQIAEKLNKAVAEIYAIRAKYKHLLTEDHCVLTNVDANKILLWSDLGLDKLKEFFSQEQEIMAARKWTESQKERQRALIQTWEPSQNSTGAKTKEGKAKVSRNALKTGNHTALKKLERSKIKTQIDKEILELESQISDLKSQIMDLKNDRRQLSAMSDLQIVDFKAKYPHNITQYEKKWINARIEYESGGVTLSQLAHKLGVSVRTVERRSSRESWCKSKESRLDNKPIQLTIATDDDATDDNQCETIYDRMRAFAAQNGIEIKTMQT